MRRRIGLLAVSAVTALLGSGLVPTTYTAALGTGIVGVEEASAQKSGGNVDRLGDNAADLFSDILGPIIIVMVAAVGLYAFMKREIGIAMTAAATALFLGLFVFAPETAQRLIEGFWKKVA